MINVGDIYECVHTRGSYHPYNQFIKVLSVTLTHVYIRTIRTGCQRNVLIEDFKNEYVGVPRKKNTHYNEEETLS